MMRIHTAIVVFVVLGICTTAVLSQSACCGNSCADAAKTANAAQFIASCANTWKWDCGRANYFSNAAGCAVFCGDGICDTSRGESTANCADDCGVDQTTACNALGPVASNPLYTDAFGYQLGNGVGGTNVTAAWALGYTGSGITVSVIDDGVQWYHPEFRCKYSSTNSWSIQTNTADPDPFAGAYAGQAAPYTGDQSHGTFCAGIAVAASNGNCSVGMAYEATLAGVRYLGPNNPTISSTVTAFTYRSSVVDVYSMSLGASDDGTTLDVPKPLINSAFLDNVQNGRGGKGTIIVHASGNGAGGLTDYCSYDAYCNVPWTIDVGSVDVAGTRASYSEFCSCLFVVAPGGEASGNNARGMVSSDLLKSGGYVTTGDGMCSTGANNLQGTSFATPAVSGVVALILQANSNLGWRDVQHIIARTTDKNDPTDAGWTTNGAGLKINPQYGFGKINAGNAVSLAKMWTNVGSQLSTQSATQSAALSVTSTAFVSTTFTVSSSFTSITKLEHVVLRVTATNANTAGTNNLRIVLVSPSGTESIMAYGRTNTDGANFNDYPLMSVHFWGESPTGVWTVKAKLNGAGDSYTLNSFSLQLMGTGPGCSNCGTTQSGSEATAFMSTLLAAVLALLFLSSLTM